MSDEPILNDALAAATPAIEDLVTNALHRGVSLDTLALLVERAFDGKVCATCIPRDLLVSQFGADARLAPEVRRTIVLAMTKADAGELPAAILVQCEGYVAAGVRRLPGRLVTVS